MLLLFIDISTENGAAVSQLLWLAHLHKRCPGFSCLGTSAFMQTTSSYLLKGPVICM